MNKHDQTEDLLRSALREKATEAHSTLTLDDVRRDAAATRRRSAWRPALAAAAVLVVVGAPTAFALRGGDEPSPTPSPTPAGTVSTPPSPSPTLPGLDSIPRGQDPHLAYLHDGVVHEADGSTTRLPAGADDVAQFTPYHGGWIVLDSVGGLAQYDNTGAVVRRSSSGGSAVAVSLDRTETAFQTDDHVVVGIASGMGDAEADHAIGPKGGLVGFLRGGVVYNSLPGAVRMVGGNGVETPVDNLETADATSWIGDLVSGATDGGTRGRVVSAESGDVLWTSPDWLPEKFSSDGRHVAAVTVGEEPHEVAILDSRTGTVQATYSLDSLGATLSCPISWDGDADAVVFCAATADHEAVLRLDAHGTVTRATSLGPATRAPSWVFETTP